MYLHGTLDIGLWFPKHTNFTLQSYIDVDWEGGIDIEKEPTLEPSFWGSV